MQYRLQNGLEVILEENHAAPVIAMSAWVRVGSADEPDRLAGIAHVFEHMLFKGTKKRGVGQIAREVEGAGGEINAWTGHDETVYHLVLASAFFGTGLDVLSDALQNSTFDPGELERERKVVLEEIKQGLDDPDRVAAQALFSAAFDQHPYGRPVIGSPATVSTMSRDDLLRFFADHYVASNTTIVIVGDFSAAAARAAIEAAFGRMPQGLPMPARPVQPPQQGLRVVATARDVKELQLHFGFHVPAINHEDVPALDLLAVVLGQGESSRLHVEVVRNRALVTGASAYNFLARDPGLLMVSAHRPAGRVEDAARAILDEVFRLTHEDPSPEEFAKARTILESDRIYERETVQGYAHKLGFFAAIARDADHETRYLERLARLSPADLRRTAASVLRAENMTVVAQVPQGPAAKAGAADKAAEQLRAVVAAAQERAMARLGRQVISSDVAEIVVQRRFRSGLRLIVQRDPQVAVVAVRATWLGGLRLEDARSNGVSNLIAGLLTRGTKGRSAEQIAAMVEGMAGSLSGYSGKNSLGVHAQFLSRFWEQGLDLVIDSLRNATFSESELEKERRIVIDEIRAEEDDLGQMAFKLFHETLWQKHPYRLNPLGSAASVAGLTRRKILSHFREHYDVGNLVLAVVGDVDPQRVVARVEALLGQVDPARMQAPVVALEPPLAQPLVASRTMPREQAHVVLGFPGTTLDDPDRFALEILSQVLAGQGGRLFVEIREKRALAYRVSAFSMEGIDPGYFAVYVASTPAHLDEAVAAIRDELKRVVESGVTDDELERAKRYLIGTSAIALQRKGSIATSMAFHEAYGQGWDYLRKYPALMQGVTAADVLRVARKVLDSKREVTAILKPAAAGAPPAAFRTARVSGAQKAENP